MDEEEIKAVLVELKAGVESRDEKHAAKIQALETQLKQLEAKSNRTALGMGGEGRERLTRDAPSMERASRLPEVERKAFEAFARFGQVEKKAMLEANDAAGGYLAGPELAAQVATIGAEMGAIRSLARGYNSRTGDFHIPILSSLAGASWIGESGTRSATATPDVAKVHPPSAGLYAVAPISNWLLQDSSYDVASLIMESIAAQFGATESAAFVSGDAVAKPSGFLTNAQSELSDSTRPFGTVQKVKSGSLTEIDVDALISLRSALAPRFRKNAAWVMHPSTEDALRKLRTATDGPYAWSPALDAASPNLLLGNPVVLDAAALGRISPVALPIAIADWQQFYAVVDIGNMIVLRDQLTSRGNTLFFVEKRVGGAVVNSLAGKVMVMAT